jgi:hypothetical protein
MMKIALALFTLVFSLYANETIANNFLQFKGVNKTIVDQSVLVYDSTNVADIYHLSGGGYVVVATSQQASPIKAYSFKSNFEALPQPYKTFLTNELYVIMQQRSLSKQTGSDAISDRWAFLENYVPQRKLNYTVNNYLIQTNWDQSPRYNKYFPKVGDDQTIAGCVQVAIGQIMRYYEHPQRGNGVVAHDAPITTGTSGAGTFTTVRTEPLKAVLNRYYNWTEMPNVLDSSVKTYQEDEIAYLMRDLVIVNRASIGVGETSTSANLAAMIMNFGYSKNVARMTTETGRPHSVERSTFIAKLKEEIDNDRPVAFSIPGHMVVADGYSDNQAGNFIHLNMGWGGTHNDFYNIDETINAGGYSFPITNLDLIYNLVPCSEAAGDCYPNLEVGDVFGSSSVGGSLSAQYDADEFSLYLKGSTTIPIVNYGYFVELYDSNHTLLQSEYDQDIVQTLDVGKYFLRVSMQRYSGSYFPDLTDYNVSFSTQSVTSEEQTAIDTALEVPPMIDMTLDDRVISANEKIVINAYDENDDNMSFDVLTNDSLSASFTNNILSLTPNVAQGSSDVLVRVQANGEATTKQFKVLMNDSDVPFGKEMSVGGTFTSADDTHEFDLILDGICTIEGDRGYSNQAFFTALHDENNNTLEAYQDETLTTTNLGHGIYKVLARLDGYTYDENGSNNDFTLSVSCPDADENVSTIATILGITISDDNLTFEENNTTVENNETNISLQTGWNLVALPTTADIATIVGIDQAVIVYGYEAGSWKVYSDYNASMVTSVNNATFGTITNTAVNKGYWVYLNAPMSIEFDGNDITPMDNNLASGWHLLASATPLENISTSLPFIWYYDQGKWLVNSNNAALVSKLQTLGYETLETIPKYRGFWLKK